MKISIDTKEDSREEIKKLIRMLSALIGEQEIFSNEPTTKSADIFSDETSSSSAESGNSVFGNLFGGGSSEETPTPAVVPFGDEPEEDKKDDDDDPPSVQIIY